MSLRLKTSVVPADPLMPAEEAIEPAVPPLPTWSVPAEIDVEPE